MAFWLSEDIDFRGHFCHPECPAFSCYVKLYTQTAQRRGADPNIGPRLPQLLVEAGFEAVQMNIVQPAAMSGEVKIMPSLTLENIADAVLAEGLASRAELDRLIQELYEFASDPQTLISGPRIVEAWGYRHNLSGIARNLFTSEAGGRALGNATRAHQTLPGLRERQMGRDSPSNPRP